MFGSAGDPSGLPGREMSLRKPIQAEAVAELTSTMSGAPEPSVIALDPPGPNATILPSFGRCGRGPAFPINTMGPKSSSPVGTTLANALNTDVDEYDGGPPVISHSSRSGR